MIIKLLKQPIISVNEAEIAGTVDGVVIKGNRIQGVYHGNMENHFAISVDNAVFGSDAVMFRDVTAMTRISRNAKILKSMLDVYNTEGTYLGELNQIETDEDFVIRYIYAGNYKIAMSKVVKYESVLIADVREDELEEAEAGTPGMEEAAAPGNEPGISMEIGSEIKLNEEKESARDEEKEPEASELSVVRPRHQNEEASHASGVDAKYAYLCGKQLLEGIEIDGVYYDKGTVIGPTLIKRAISSNAIVKVIVNAEE